MNTMRCGFFRASELNPVSWLVFLSSIFVLYRQAAIFLNPPKVHSDKQNRRERQHHAVQYIEAQESVFAHKVAAQELETDVLAEDRHSRNDVGAHGDGPKRELVPRKQIACVAQ